MADLEKIIRPFETRSVAPVVLPPSSGTPPDNVVLTYGLNSADGGGGSGSRTSATGISGSGVGTDPTSGGSSTTPPSATTGVIGHYSNEATWYMTKQEREKGTSTDPLGLSGFKTAHF
jgi:hypothetical protein